MQMFFFFSLNRILFFSCFFVSCSAIDDVNGQLFWKTSFSNAKENVPFREFCIRFFGQFEGLKGKLPPGEEMEEPCVFFFFFLFICFFFLCIFQQRKKRLHPCLAMSER